MHWSPHALFIFWCSYLFYLILFSVKYFCKALWIASMQERCYTNKKMCDYLLNEWSKATAVWLWFHRSQCTLTCLTREYSWSFIVLFWGVEVVMGWGLISDGMQVKWWGRRRGCVLSLPSLQTNWEVSNAGHNACVQSWPGLRKRQQVDKCYSHMKTDSISRLNIFWRGSACGRAELHCSATAKPWLHHSNTSLNCFKSLRMEKSEKIPARFTLVAPPHVCGVLCALTTPLTSSLYFCRMWHQLFISKFWIILSSRAAASSFCQSHVLVFLTDVPAWEKNTQARMLIESTVFTVVTT